MPYLGTVELKSSDIRRIDITSSTSATHTLTWTAPNEQSLIVTINGVKQQNNYTVSGTTLTLDTALSASDLLEVIGINDIGTTITPAQGSVDTDQLANDAVTSAKIAAGTIATADIADDAVDADKLANSINTEIAANTAKVTNATHTGDVTGATALTIATGAVDIAMLSATGTASSSTFLRGDNSWVSSPVVQLKEAYSTSTVSLVNTAGGQSASFGLGSGRVYGDLTTVTITPTSTSNNLLMLGFCGMNNFASSNRSNKGAFGLSIVFDETTGYDESSFHGYPNSDFPNYPPSPYIAISVTAPSTSSISIDLKAWSYNESTPSSSNDPVFYKGQLIVMEVA